jgi:hypothetical protein
VTARADTTLRFAIAFRARRNHLAYLPAQTMSSDRKPRSLNRSNSGDFGIWRNESIASKSCYAVERQGVGEFRVGSDYTRILIDRVSAVFNPSMSFDLSVSLAEPD